MKQQNADWAAWENRLLQEADERTRVDEARRYRDWKNWELLHDQPSQPRMRKVKIEAGVTLGGTQPAKKARWIIEIPEGLDERLGFHFSLEKLPQTPEACGPEQRTSTPKARQGGVEWIVNLPVLLYVTDEMVEPWHII